MCLGEECGENDSTYAGKGCKDRGVALGFGVGGFRSLEGSRHRSGGAVDLPIRGRELLGDEPDPGDDDLGVGDGRFRRARGDPDGGFTQVVTDLQRVDGPHSVTPEEVLNGSQAETARLRWRRTRAHRSIAQALVKSLSTLRNCGK